MSEKADQAISGAALIVAGGAVIFAGFLALLVAATNALVMWLPPEHASWLAPLIVGAVVLVIGFIALASGRSELKARNLAPTRTLRSLRRDGRIVKEHLQ
jgi:xanthine/uracil permease